MVAGYRNKKQNRYWWFTQQDIHYLPFPFSVLANDELCMMDDWYEDTDKKGFHGEVNVPAMAFISGMLLGNNMRNIVQLGHFAGFSTLLFGFVMRSMGHKRSIFTIDVSEGMSLYTESWVKRASLDEYVEVVVADSADKHLPERAQGYFNDTIENVFVDSSHQYDHTMRELRVWYPALKEHGFLYLHDVSDQAQGYDSTQRGGVKRALSDWCKGEGVASFAVNGHVKAGSDLKRLVYKDGCGLGLIQKAPKNGNGADKDVSDQR